MNFFVYGIAGLLLGATVLLVARLALYGWSFVAGSGGIVANSLAITFFSMFLDVKYMLALSTAIVTAAMYDSAEWETTARVFLAYTFMFALPLA